MHWMGQRLHPLRLPELHRRVALDPPASGRHLDDVPRRVHEVEVDGTVAAGDSHVHVVDVGAELRSSLERAERVVAGLRARRPALGNVEAVHQPALEYRGPDGPRLAVPIDRDGRVRGLAVCRSEEVLVGDQLDEPLDLGFLVGIDHPAPQRVGGIGGLPHSRSTSRTPTIGSIIRASSYHTQVGLLVILLAGRTSCQEHIILLLSDRPGLSIRVAMAHRVPLHQLIGARLRQLREAAELRQEDIATQARWLGLTDWVRGQGSDGP